MSSTMFFISNFMDSSIFKKIKSCFDKSCTFKTFLDGSFQVGVFEFYTLAITCKCTYRCKSSNHSLLLCVGFPEKFAQQ